MCLADRIQLVGRPCGEVEFTGAHLDKVKRIRPRELIEPAGQPEHNSGDQLTDGQRQPQPER